MGEDSSPPGASQESGRPQAEAGASRDPGSARAEGPQAAPEKGQGGDSPYSTVKVQKWGSGTNDSVWNSLKGAGWSDREIVEKGLVHQVAQLNGLENPDIVQIGQELRVPRKGEGGAPDGAAPAGGSGQASTAKGATDGGPGDRSLQDQIMERARSIGGDINATGGYRFDGTNDCYGFVRRVWDPVLQEKGLSRLPVSDGPNSADWDRINDWGQLKPGDVLATSQGHQWGDRWHGGLYAGTDEQGRHQIYDNSSGQGGAKLRVLPSNDFFTHFYRPTHELLGQGNEPAGAQGPSGSGEIPNYGSNPSRTQIGDQLDETAARYGIDPNMLRAVAWQESTWRADASSFDGGHGKGVMQIDDRYHAFARGDAVWDPAANIDYGAKYLRDLYNQTGSWDRALLRYNGGSSYPGKIRAHMANQPWTAYV
ncbi:MAG: transglycosylase SLT domain-containing protein [Armatimonadetes bacterium]|nr:transglycosylase SLT domain-containing protein [Armatimonadota bacterium]